MPNRYMDLPGQEPISETYQNIEAGFDAVQDDIDSAAGVSEGIQAEVTEHKDSTAAHAAEHIVYTGPIAGANNAKEAIDSLQEQFNTAVVSGDSSPAADQARISSTGTTYPSLKSRLDTERDGLAAQLADITINARSYGAEGDGTIDARPAFAAMAASGAYRYLIPPGIHRIASNFTFPFGSILLFAKGAVLKPDNGVTITVGNIEGVKDYQIFDVSAGGIVHTTQSIVRPDWWGNIERAVRAAIDALPISGGTVKLNNKTYKPNGYRYGYAENGESIYKDNVTIEGAVCPRIADDCKSIVDGSVIQGMLLVYANNFQISNVGIDCGHGVVNTYYGGTVTPVVTEGLLLTYPNDAEKAANALRRGARLHNVIALAYNPTAPVHAMIVGEGYEDVTCTGEQTVCYGMHGIVVKCKNVKGGIFTAYGNGTNGVIFKSSTQNTAKVYNVHVDRISTYKTPPGQPYETAPQTYGTLLHGEDGDLDIVSIGSIYSEGATNGVASLLVDGFNISNLQIGQITTDDTHFGMLLQAGTGKISNAQIGRVISRNTHDGVVCNWDAAGEGNVSFESIQTVNATGVSLAANRSPIISVGTLEGAHCAEGLMRITGNARLSIGLPKPLAGTPTLFSASNGGVVAELYNGWTQVANNSRFGVELVGGGITLRGLLNSGTSNVIGLLPFYARPATTKRFMIQGCNTSNVQSAVPLVINEDGTVKINEIAGGIANANQWLSLDSVSYSLIG